MSKCYLVFIMQGSYKCLVEKIGLLDELCSGMSSSTVGHKFIVNKSYVCVSLCMFENRNTNFKPLDIDH